MKVRLLRYEELQDISLAVDCENNDQWAGQPSVGSLTRRKLDNNSYNLTYTLLQLNNNIGKID